MKLAPNVKQQPRGIKHKETEVIIFAGSDAWSHAKQWQEQDARTAGDNDPPVVLADEQLKDIGNLKIVPDGRTSARIYRAGHLAPVMIKAIGQKLAAAGVQDANFYPEGMYGQEVQNWREYLARERQNLSDGLVIELPVKQKAQLSQMADSERAQMLAGRFDGVCVHPESEIVHVWRSGVWCPVSTMEL
ncbi:DNA primase, partial [Escherichia coli]|nr:DNA primase [Escherichia coli]